MIIASYLLLLAFLVVFVVSFGLPFFRGAPYAPTDKKGIDIMVKLADIKPGDKAVDIGSGDGRLVTALARAGAQVEGYEINPLLVLFSRQRIIKAELTDKATIIKKSIWEADYSPYNVVLLFGIPYIMKRLTEKFEAELKPGTRIVSNRFTIPGWKPVKSENNIYLYIKQ
jgi:cyclopropane fatty-acyl-phospholipid synthase-like methyltransferase